MPSDSSIEDIQYHVYGMEKVRKVLESIDTDGGISQEEAEARLSKWLII
ncbi:MAG: hypothetical protein ABIP78_06660 [Pyrinomonadaceae bacterium]